MNLQVAQVGPALLEALGPIIACVMVFGIPIVAILVKHQQKMAMIMREDSARHHSITEVSALRQDVDVLKATVNQQTILLDTIASQQREIMASIKAADELEQRLKS